MTAEFIADIGATDLEDALLYALEAWDGRIDLSSAAFRTVEDQDWERAWKAREKFDAAK